MRARLLLVALLVALVCAGIYAMWAVGQVRGDLTAARQDATRLQAAIEEGDQPAARAALTDLQQSATDARRGSDGPVFEVLSWLPGVGDDVDGVRRVSSAMDVLAARGLPPLVATAGDVSAGAFLPENGQVPLGRISRLQQPVAQAGESFAEAEEMLAGGDPQDYVDSLAAPYVDLQNLVTDGADALAAAETATRLLPGMLGAEGERRYIALFQNNAELRTTGGLPGAAALVTADDGQVAMGRQTASLPRTDEPVLKMSKAERYLYEEKLGTYYQDANFIPHFPRVSELVAAHWERNFDEQVDGVVAFDPIVLSYLLEGTGPVEVGGQTVSADNAIDVLLHETYQRLGPAEQDAFFAEVARAVFEKVSAGKGDPRVVLEALARGVRERRLLVTSFDAAEQEELRGSRIAGEVNAADQEPQLGVYLNDATMSKLTYFLDYEVSDIVVESCADGVQQLRGRLTLHSSVPEGGKGLTESVLGASGGFGKRGDQMIQVELHAPQGGTIEEVTADDESRPVEPGMLRDHEVIQAFLLVRPQGEHHVDFEMTAPAGVDELDVRVTPGVETEDESTLDAVGCPAAD